MRSSRLSSCRLIILTGLPTASSRAAQATAAGRWRRFDCPKTSAEVRSRRRLTPLRARPRQMTPEPERSGGRRASPAGSDSPPVPSWRRACAPRKPAVTTDRLRAPSRFRNARGATAVSVVGSAFAFHAKTTLYPLRHLPQRLAPIPPLSPSGEQREQRVDRVGVLARHAGTLGPRARVRGRCLAIWQPALTSRQLAPETTSSVLARPADVRRLAVPRPRAWVRRRPRSPAPPARRQMRARPRAQRGRRPTGAGPGPRRPAGCEPATTT
jgi:hypothetical protein